MSGRSVWAFKNALHRQRGEFPRRMHALTEDELENPPPDHASSVGNALESNVFALDTPTATSRALFSSSGVQIRGPWAYPITASGLWPLNPGL
jgi:hypothetical protein